MFKILIAIVSTVVIGTGGYLGYQEFVEAKTEKVKTVQKEVKEEKVAKLEVEEVQNILQNNLDSIFDVFTKSGKVNGWNNANPADFSKIKPDLLAFATEEFTDGTLKGLSADFYCECDKTFRPNYSNDVRFSFEQNKENKLKITVLDPATEISNMGTMWEFELSKADDSWKMNQWNYESLDTQDIQLTKEEAEKLLTNENEKPEFVKEYESKESGGKAYLFIMKSSNGDRLAAISSKSTQLVYDFEDKSTQSNEQKNEVEPTQPEPVPSGQTEEKIEEPSNNASSKADYLAKLEQTETKERRNEYQNDYQMTEDYGFNYQLWDGLLNEIYNVLKTQLSESEMNKLKNEQIKWVDNKEKTAQARYDEEGGGSMSSMVKVETLANLTKERCYELVNTYMK